MLVELSTYRLSVHTTADDPSKYRSEEEEEEWKERDPLPRFQGYLIDKGVIDRDEIEELESEIEEEIDAVWDEASQEIDSLSKKPERIFEHVYAELPTHLEQQRRRMSEGVA